MSSDLAYIAFLSSVQKYLFQYGGPILIAIGTFSCILSLAVFARKNLRNNPCSIYLIALNIANLLLIYTSILITVLVNGYNMYDLLTSLIFCRFYIYITVVSDILPPSYLILASIDRILITSPNAVTRRKSTRRLAYICIAAVTIFWVCAHSYNLVLIELIQIAPSYSICYLPQKLLEGQAYYSLTVKAIIVPAMMIVLGLYPIRNIRRVHRNRVAAVALSRSDTGGGDLYAINSKQMQLARITLSNIGVYLIFSLMISIVLMYQGITQYNDKTYLQTQIESFVLNVARFIDFIPFCVDLYTNIFVSKTFRNEMKNLFTLAN
ncbi:unnamed protein product [Adineta ricciae]|uniref:G-protein coupled receptors family 1 profile domain-containing protein n=1 Tax=Adineta ricciae TaxID=249248 RepID=A0A814REM9_ADIRI|nr:unnamed protein product [Adineta ricciae]